VGLKPTYGLVPYTGIFPIENSIDHAGPICLTVEDAALLLEVIAGKDGLDPRQYAELQPEEYTQSMKGSVKGLKIGVVKEGFNWDGRGKETEEAVRDAAFALGKAGTKVKEISVPLHRDGIHIFTPIIMEGAAMQMTRLNGFGVGWKGHYSTNAQTFYGKARKARADSYSLLTKLLILCGHYMYDEYQGHYYAKAQNQTRTLAEEYNKALKEVDVLAMPTTAPQGEAMEIIEDPSLEELIAQTFMYHYNTCPFDATGHPALSVPCAKYNGLPVGLMLIGRHFEESTILKAAHAFQDMGLYQ